MTSPTGARGVFAFALRAIAFGAVLFALWYVAARPISFAVAWGAARIVQGAAPVENASARSSAAGQVSIAAGLEGMEIEIPVDPRKQTFGLPFFIALLLASRPPRFARRAALGAAILLGLAACGVASEVAITLGTLAGPSGAPPVRFGTLAATSWALGFQLGTLIIPTVVPTMLWVAMDPRALRAASGRLRPNLISA